MRRENCVNNQWYCRTVAEVCGTWCTKNDARSLFPVGARSDYMAIRNTSIFGKVYLFSDTVVWRDFSINTMPKDLPNSQYIFVAVAALNTQGHSWTWSIIERWNLSFLAVLSSNKLKSPQFGISKICRLLATCRYLSGVCALSSSRDIAQYRLNSPIYTAHKSTSALKHVIYLYLENYSWRLVP